jgi:hypothetical protein
VSGTISGTTLTAKWLVTLNTAAQPNITSVGTLTSLTLSGAFIWINYYSALNVNVSNITTSNMTATNVETVRTAAQWI